MEVKLNEYQLKVIIGTLLGDACITNGGVNRNYLYEYSQKVDNEYHVRYIHRILEPYTKSIRFRTRKKPTRIDGKVRHDINNGYSKSCEFRTCSASVFTELRSIWYKKNNGKTQKIVPRDLNFDWEIVALWACDDGSNRPDKKEYCIWTQGFEESDVEFLVYKLYNDLRIKANINHKYGKPVIRIGVNSYEFFVDGIKKHIHSPCMKYKGANCVRDT